jgi:hypothetical protein
MLRCSKGTVLLVLALSSSKRLTIDTISKVSRIAKRNVAHLRSEQKTLDWINKEVYLRHQLSTEPVDYVPRMPGSPLSPFLMATFEALSYREITTPPTKNRFYR